MKHPLQKTTWLSKWQIDVQSKVKILTFWKQLGVSWKLQCNFGPLQIPKIFGKTFGDVDWCQFLLVFFQQDLKKAINPPWRIAPKDGLQGWPTDLLSLKMHSNPGSWNLLRLRFVLFLQATNRECVALSGKQRFPDFESWQRSAKLGTSHNRAKNIDTKFPPK